MALNDDLLQVVELALAGDWDAAHHGSPVKMKPP
jgi:hypothetical protein